MLQKRTTIFVLIFLILVLAALLIPSGTPRMASPKGPINNEQLPIRKVWVTLAQNQHDQLFEQLRKFADKHAFAIRITPTAAPDDRFLVQMWREDIKIIASDSLDPGLFKIGFYNTYNESPISVRVFDELIVELKEFIGEVPGSTFTVKE